MTSLEHILRFLCVPVAMSLFLVTAKISGGFQFRDTPVVNVAMK